MLRGSLALAVSMALVVGSVRAEVRLRPGSVGRPPSVAVLPTTSGPWTPQGRLDSCLLNPLGDLVSDGIPATAASEHGVLVAWRDAASGELALAVGRSAWERLPNVPEPASPAAPRILAVQAGWIAAWDVPGERAVAVAAIWADGTTTRFGRVAAGTVQGLVGTGGTGHLLCLDSVLGLTDTVFAIPMPEPLPRPWLVRQTVVLADALQPIPTPESTPDSWRAQQRVIMNPEGQASTHFAPSLVPVQSGGVPSGGHANSGVVIHGLPNRGITSLGRAMPAVLLIPGEDAALAVWWLDAHALGFVELLDGGVGPLRKVTGRGDFSPSLVREALRIAGE